MLLDRLTKRTNTEGCYSSCIIIKIFGKFQENDASASDCTIDTDTNKAISLENQHFNHILTFLQIHNLVN